MSSTVEYRATEELPDGVNVAIAARPGRVIFLIRAGLTVAAVAPMMCALADVYMADLRLVEMLGA